MEFILNGRGGAAFSSAVEFGKNHGAGTGNGREFAGLRKGIAADSGIQGQQSFMRGFGKLFADDAQDLGRSQKLPSSPAKSIEIGRSITPTSLSSS